MPIYMDRHDAPEEVTPAMVAEMHKLDAKYESQFKVKIITYWWDNQRKNNFCLVDAPTKKALKDLHRAAHGDVPHRIIKVDPSVVETFLGRIEDPPEAAASPETFSDSAFRTIMVIQLNRFSLKKSEDDGLTSALQKYSRYIVKTIDQHGGRIVNQNLESYLVSFKSALQGVNCALKVQAKLKDFFINSHKAGLNLKITLSGDTPVTREKTFFERAIKLAERMCYVKAAPIVVSAEVHDLYISESHKKPADNNLIYSLSKEEESFLTQLMERVEETWTDTSLNVEDYNNQLGLSKSQLFRKTSSITGLSPNNFLRDYRLGNALKMLLKQKGNISEIAFDTGFNSPSYFSKSFLKQFGVSPSDYLQQFTSTD